MSNPARKQSILFGQQQRCHAAVGLGDDPQRVFAVALARPGRVDRVDRQDTPAVLQRVVVGRSILDIDTAPIA